MAGESPTQVLDRILEPVGRCLDAGAARRIAALHADPAAQCRIDALAERANEGALTPDELAEYEAYVAAGQFVAILQAKARAILQLTRADG